MNVANPLPSNPLTSMVPAVPLANRSGGTSGSASETAPAARQASPRRTGDEQPGRSVEQGEDTARAGANQQGLEPAELKQLSELKARDREVRAHEAAHQAAGGQYAGAISYVYQRGPDGAQYAVGGEVSIDTSPVDGNPQATIEKMRTVRAAALAPAEPSSQDRAVAAQAMQLMLQAQAELAVESGGQREQASEPDENNGGSRAGQDASRTYESVFGLGDASTAKSSSQPFQATA